MTEIDTLFILFLYLFIIVNFNFTMVLTSITLLFFYQILLDISSILESNFILYIVYIIKNIIIKKVIE
jgi:hypothetical protein